MDTTALVVSFRHLDDLNKAIREYIKVYGEQGWGVASISTSVANIPHNNGVDAPWYCTTIVFQSKESKRI